MRIRIVHKNLGDEAVGWVPAEPFTVDGIRYDFEERGDIVLQPMIRLKKTTLDDDDDLDSPHISSDSRFFWLTTGCREWRGIPWNPDIRF